MARRIDQEYDSAGNMIEDYGYICGFERVRHGRWVWNNDAIDWNIGAWVCSECGGRNENIHAAMPSKVKAFSTNPYIYAGTKFCPNCGAKMDAEVEG